MATRKRKAKATVHPLDAEPYRTMTRRTAALIKEALAHYGEPTMTLEELQQALSEALPGVSFADWIIEDRRAGF